jgi:hypothetical protein
MYTLLVFVVYKIDGIERGFGIKSIENGLYQ